MPLTAEGRTVGVLVVQTYSADQDYTDADLDLARVRRPPRRRGPPRARTIEETRQRNAELALINEIGQALVPQLEFAAIIELVGERDPRDLRDRSAVHRPLRPGADILTFPYDIDGGAALRPGEFHVGPGLTSTVLRERRSLRIGTSEESRRGRCHHPR